MPDLDDVLNATSGRQLADRAGRAAAGGDPSRVDDLLRRGVRRGRRVRAAAVAGVAAATLAAVGVGVGLSGGLSADAPAPPVDTPSDDASRDGGVALEDLTPQEVAASRFARAPEVALGDEPDSRLVWWTATQRGTCRAVGAVTTDDGGSWAWADLPGRGCDSGTTVVALPEGGGWAVSRYLSRDVLVVGLDGAVSSVRPGPATGVPMNAAQVLLPVGPDGPTTIVTPDGTARTAGWDPPTGGPSTELRDPVGRVVAATAGRSFDLVGSQFCCGVGMAVRWSDDGGASFETHDLTEAGEAAGEGVAEFGLSTVVESYADDTLAVIEGGETRRGPRGGVPVAYGAVQRTTDDGSTWERYDLLPDAGAFGVTWSLVAPDGTLLVWHDTLGLLRTDGEDWSSLDLATVELPTGPARGVPTGLGGLVDHREVDGELQLLVRTGDGGWLLSSDTGRTWTGADPLP